MQSERVLCSGGVDQLDVSSVEDITCNKLLEVRDQLASLQSKVEALIKLEEEKGLSCVGQEMKGKDKVAG